MIFVTVGTHTDGFERLVAWMNDLAADRAESVVMQVGHTDRKPEHAAWFEFEDVQKILALTERADVVVGHGGAGTILTTVRTGTPIVCVPRLAAHGESYDDHQLELATRLASRGTVTVATTKDELRDALSRPREDIDVALPADLISHLDDRLAALEEEVS